MARQSNPSQIHLNFVGKVSKKKKLELNGHAIPSYGIAIFDGALNRVKCVNGFFFNPISMKDDNMDVLPSGCIKSMPIFCQAQVQMQVPTPNTMDFG